MELPRSPSPPSASCSRVLASVVPAWLASRQDVVAGAGRAARRPQAARVDARSSAWRCSGAGIATSASTARRPPTTAAPALYWIGASAIVSVLGMILVVPVVVSTVARLARRLPLTPRYAARDAAPPPHPHRAGRGRRRRDRGRRRGARHRHREPGARRTRRPTPRRRQMGPGVHHPEGGASCRARRRRTRRRSGTGSRQPWRDGRARGGRRASSAVASESLASGGGWTSTSVRVDRPRERPDCLSTLGLRPGGGRGHLGGARASTRRRGRHRRPRRSRPVGAVVLTERAWRRRDDVTVRTETWREGNDQAEVEPSTRRSPADWSGLGPRRTGCPPRRRRVLPTAVADALGHRGGRPSSCASPVTWTRAPRRASPSRSEASRTTPTSTSSVATSAPRRGRRGPAGARRARRRPDARRHPHRHLPRPLGRPARPGHAVRGRSGSAHPAAGRGVVRPRRRLRSARSSELRSASSPASPSRNR